MEYSFAGNEYINYILDTYSNMLIRLAFTYLKNTADAEDIVQEVFVALIKRGEGFDNDEHEKAWLIRVTINKCKNFLNSGWTKRTVVLEDNVSTTDKHDEDDIIGKVMALPEKYRTVIHLYYYEEYSIEEIASLLGKSKGTVGTRLARGRARLKTDIEKMGGSEK